MDKLRFTSGDRERGSSDLHDVLFCAKLTLLKVQKLLAAEGIRKIMISDDVQPFLLSEQRNHRAWWQEVRGRLAALTEEQRSSIYEELQEVRQIVVWVRIRERERKEARGVQEQLRKLSRHVEDTRDVRGMLLHPTWGFFLQSASIMDHAAFCEHWRRVPERDRRKFFSILSQLDYLCTCEVSTERRDCRIFPSTFPLPTDYR